MPLNKETKPNQSICSKYKTYNNSIKSVTKKKAEKQKRSKSQESKTQNYKWMKEKGNVWNNSQK